MSFPTNQQFSDLIQRASAVVDKPGLRSVLRQLVALALDSTGASYGALGVIGSYRTLSDFIYVGMPDDLAQKIGHLPVGGGVLGTLIRHPTPIVVDDIALHEDFSGFPPDHPPMHSFLGVPVRAGDDVYGNLYLTEKPGGFTEEDLATASALSAIAGGVVSSVRLHERLSKLAVLEDRERIARDLHDSVIQDLFATGLSLQALTMRTDIDETAGHRLDDAVDRIDTAIDTLRSFIFDLRRSTSEQTRRKELEQSLHRLCTDGQHLTMALAPLDDLDTSTYESLTAIVKEAVANACRHSGSTTITVKAMRLGSNLELVVSDRGKGFDIGRPQVGMGLANMHARVAEIAGTLDVEAGPSSGTAVTVRIPSMFD